MIADLKAEFETLSPLFLGGCEQTADLRPPSLKGLLRFWYRAVDPEFQQHEPALFGGATGSAGQSSFLLRIESRPFTAWKWDRNQMTKFNTGQGRNTRNGLVYLGYPFQLSGNEDRTAIPPGHRFTVRCVVPARGGDDKVRRAVTASLWLLGTLGALGTRSRRGFGSLALREWKAEQGDWPELKSLPLIAASTNTQQWRSELQRVLDLFRKEWFPPKGNREMHQPHLGPKHKIILQNRSFPRNQWDAALAHMGGLMQNYRLRLQPDYDDVKRFVSDRRPLQYAPNRASFGLPLTFRFTSVRGPSVTLTPYDREERTTSERQGSLLQLRIAAIQDRLHPLFLRLDGDVPGANPPAALRGSGAPLRASRTNAMDDFLASKEVVQG